MEQLKNQVIVINGITYFITDDIEGLDLNTDFIPTEEVNINESLNFVENAAENVEGFDLTDEFFGVIEALPEKTKKAFYKTSDENPTLQLERQLNWPAVTTIPITFDTPVIATSAKQEKSPPKNKTQIIVQKSKNNNTASQRTASNAPLAQQFTNQNRVQKIIVKVKQKADNGEKHKVVKPILEEGQEAVSLVLDNGQTVSPSTCNAKRVLLSNPSNNEPEALGGVDESVHVERRRERQEQTSFLSSFNTKLPNFEPTDFEESAIEDAGKQAPDTLGSSENPIQLVQKGSQFHSVQPLTQEQLQQVAAILRQQNKKDLMKNTENVVFDKKTNTKIVCKIVYPENKMKKKGRPFKSIPITVPIGADDTEGDEEEEKGKKVEIKRTRYGRLSKPPRYAVRDYKRLNKLTEDGAEVEGSDGGYSDYEVPPPSDPHVDGFPDMPRRKKRKLCTNYRCLNCGKIYLGIAKLATHYARNPTHGTIEKHLEHIAKQPLYTQDLPEQQESESLVHPEPPSAVTVEPLVMSALTKQSLAPPPDEKEYVDSDPIVEAFKPLKKRRGRPRKDDGFRKSCKLKNGLISAAAALSTFEAYATLIPRLVEITPFEHLMSCSKSAKVLAGKKGSLVPFVFEEMGKLLDELKEFVKTFLTTEELPDHETYKVPNELLRTICDLNDDIYYLRDGKKRPPRPPEPTSNSPRKIIGGMSYGTLDPSEEVVETELEGSHAEDSDDSISNLFSTEKDSAEKRDMIDLFEPERGALHDKNNADSVFEFFRDRKESLSISDIPVDTAALRQVDDIVEQVASQAGQLVSPDSDYRSPHSAMSYRNSPVSVHSSYRNSPYRQSPRIEDDRFNNGNSAVFTEEIVDSVSVEEKTKVTVNVKNVDLEALSDVQTRTEPSRPFQDLRTASHPCNKPESPCVTFQQRKRVFDTGSASCSKNSSPAHVESFPLETLPEPDLYTVTFVEQGSENVAEVEIGTFQNQVEQNVAETEIATFPNQVEQNVAEVEIATFQNQVEQNNFESVDNETNIISLEYNSDSWWT